MNPMQFMRNGLKEVRDHAHSAQVHGEHLIDQASEEILKTKYGQKAGAFLVNNADSIAYTGMVGGSTFGLTTFADPVKQEW